MNWWSAQGYRIGPRRRSRVGCRIGLRRLLVGRRRVLVSNVGSRDILIGNSAPPCRAFRCYAPRAAESTAVSASAGKTCTGSGTFGVPLPNRAAGRSTERAEIVLGKPGPDRGRAGDPLKSSRFTRLA